MNAPQKKRQALKLYRFRVPAPRSLARVFCALTLILAGSLSPAARADEVLKAHGAPSKASLLSFWEQAQKENPEITILEKTADDHVFNFATSYFPYNGHLKVLNLVIEKLNDRYTSEGAEKDVAYEGTVETELPDAAEDLQKKYPFSYSAWQRSNRFYYDSKADQWFEENMWEEHFASEKAESQEHSEDLPDDEGLMSRLWNEFGGWVPFLLFFVFVILLARRQNKRVFALHEEAATRQLASMKLAEEGMAVQKEHTELLKALLVAIQKSPRT